jgi:hypothetical protein
VAGLGRGGAGSSSVRAGERCEHGGRGVRGNGRWAGPARPKATMPLSNYSEIANKFELT